MTFLRHPVNGQLTAPTDFVLTCGVVVRVLDARAQELELLAERFGEPRPAGASAPDVVVRFTKTSRQRNPVAAGEARGEANIRIRRHPLAPRTSTWVRLEFSRFGESCEIVYPHDPGALPLLNELIAAAALRKGWLALHACAFTLAGQGVLIAGAAHVGKTGLLLSFAPAGAGIIADDFVLLAQNGGRLCSLDQRIGVSVRHLQELGWLAERLPASSLYALRAMALLGAKGRIPVAAAEVLGTGLHASSLPLKIFISTESPGRGCSFDRCAPGDAVALLARSAEEHRRALTERYARWKVQSPGQLCAWMEDLPTLAAAHLHTALQKAEVYIFRHPKRAPYATLNAALRSFLLGDAGAAALPAAAAMELKAVSR